MTWNEHVDKLVAKLQSNINLFKLCRSYISTFAARQFYFQCIHSHLISGIQIYLNLSQKCLLDSIFLKQKSVMRIIANVHQIPNYLTDTRTLCKTLNILPLPSSLVYFNSIYLEKSRTFSLKMCLFKHRDRNLWKCYYNLFSGVLVILDPINKG